MGGGGVFDVWGVVGVDTPHPYIHMTQISMPPYIYILEHLYYRGMLEGNQPLSFLVHAKGFSPQKYIEGLYRGEVIHMRR